MDKLIYWVWLSQRVSPNNLCIRQLIKEVPDPEIIYNMNEEHLLVLPYLNKVSILKLLDKDLEETKKIIEKCENNNYNIICYSDEYYPERLRNIPDFPIVLYHRGDKFLFDELLCISVVGTREPSGYGIKMAKQIARELAYNNALVISGMAFGIDASAHLGAMSVDKPTVAVLGSGIDDPTPKTNKKLYEYMLYNGCVISEYPPGARIYRSNYAVRNRIISGLSLGTVVVEAEEISGSLITARNALNQGRDVFAVPNLADNKKGDGTNNLLRDGAILVTSAKDILEEYKGMFGSIDIIKSFNESSYNKNFLKEDFIDKFADLVPIEKEVALSVEVQPTTADEISKKSNIPMNYVLSTLTMLEIKGVVKSVVGNKFMLNI
ncbi:MAG: DNA-protecting protein DprA [Ruminococcaceae bacterium]|nr:DNA-protecting protein DprA [Oscillospiraceae bacterium]